MGSGSRSCGSGFCNEAPLADKAITPQLNPEFEAMPGAEIIAHLSRSHRTADFIDATRVLVARERRLTEAMAQICALELEIANTKARARYGSSISRKRLMKEASVVKEAYGQEVDHKDVEDVLGSSRRVIAGHKVPKEEAQVEEVEASHGRRSQGKQPKRATKKARKQKGPCFYNMVFSALKEKELQQQKVNEEAIAKKASNTASKPLHCRCWWSNTPYVPSKSAVVHEDSNDRPNDS